MPFPVPDRRIAGLALLLIVLTSPVQATPGPAARAWLSDLVTRIDAADRAARRPGSDRRGGTVVVHVEIAPDGSLQRVEVERSSGSPDLDQRALRAVRGIGPLSAPPAALLGIAGVADLSVPVELGR
jgi:TonB family protein